MTKLEKDGVLDRIIPRLYLWSKRSGDKPRELVVRLTDKEIEVRGKGLHDSFKVSWDQFVELARRYSGKKRSVAFRTTASFTDRLNMEGITGSDWADAQRAIRICFPDRAEDIINRLAPRDGSVPPPDPDSP